MPTNERSLIGALFAKRYRVAVLAASVGVAAGMVSWLGQPSGGTAAITPPVSGQRVESGTVRHVSTDLGSGPRSWWIAWAPTN